MLNLPSPAPTNLPVAPPATAPGQPDPGLLAAPDALVVPDGRDGFGDLLAASVVPPLPPVEPPVADAAWPTAEPVLTEPTEPPATETVVVSALAQPWALVLVPELAALPAPASGDLEDTGDALGRGITNQASGGLWPPRSGGRVLLSATLPPIGTARPRGWQNAVPSAPATATAPPALAPPAPPPTAGVLRTITGQPIPFPTADMPPWYDPAQAPPWFDRTSPPPPWSDSTRPAPLWYDPTQLPPAWLDPARIPAAWFDAPRVVDPAMPVAAGPAAPGPAAAPVAPMARPPAASLPEAGPSPRTERPRRAPASDVAAAAERPVATAGLAFTLPSPALPAAASSAAPAPATPSGAPSPASEPALAIASERLGEVAVRLSGGPEQLQVAMQAQPAAAALIGADAPRLNQDLAAAGVALASLSVNGQRADLTGGQRERQRQPARRADDAPLSGVRRLAARQPMTRTTSVDRFA